MLQPAACASAWEGSARIASDATNNHGRVCHPAVRITRGMMFLLTPWMTGGARDGRPVTSEIPLTKRVASYARARQSPYVDTAVCPLVSLDDLARRRAPQSVDKNVYKTNGVRCGERPGAQCRGLRFQWDANMKKLLVVLLTL